MAPSLDMGWVMSIFFLSCFLGSFVSKEFRKNIIYPVYLLLLISTLSALYFTGETYLDKDILIIILVTFFAIFNFHVCLRYKAYKQLQKSEEKFKLLVTEIKQGLAVYGVMYDEEGKVNEYGFLDERKRMEKQVFDEKERLKMTLLSAGDGVISTDKYGNVELLNKIAEQLTGWTQEEAFGKKFDDIFNIINEFTREKSENLVQIILESGKSFLANHRILIAKKGTEKPVEENAAPIKDVEGNINGVVLVFRDYTDTKDRQNRIEYLSYRDQLTGLYNRRFYEEELKRLNTDRNLPISIIVGDVNGLKLVNDAFGHEKGDEFLLKAASAIQRACRTEDIAARWGGDEFVILLPKTKTEDAGEIVKRIKELYSKEHVNAVRVSIAFGWETKRKSDEDILQVLKNAEDYMYKHKIIENEGQRNNRINAIIHTLHEKIPREEKHSQRVSEICQQIGKAIGFSEIEVRKLRIVGLFHDIGKIAIDEGILNRPGKLTEQELDEIKRHPDIGYRILSSSHEMVEIADYILAHHERWDGTGYPKGLKGEAIPMVARIIALADCYDAMTSERSYRNALSEEEALAEIRNNAGTQFDPEIVKIFLEKVLVG